VRVEHPPLSQHVTADDATRGRDHRPPVPRRSGLAPPPPVQVLQVWRVAELFSTNPFFLLFVYCAPSLSLVWLQIYGGLPRSLHHFILFYLQPSSLHIKNPTPFYLAGGCMRPVTSIKFYISYNFSEILLCFSMDIYRQGTPPDKEFCLGDMGTCVTKKVGGLRLLI
jgi:hypothetical protein